MKNKIINILPILLFFGLAACSSDRLAVEKNKLQAHAENNKFRIPEKEAVAELRDFLSSFKAGTKSAGTPESNLRNKLLGSVASLTAPPQTKAYMARAMKKRLGTKSGEVELHIPDTLLYIVNFQDDGFAVLSADRRISSTIIAVVESGEISLSDFNLMDRWEELFGSGSDTLDFTYYQFDDDEEEEDDDEEEEGEEDDEEGGSLRPTLTPEQQIGDMIIDYIIGDIVGNPGSDSPKPGGNVWDTPIGDHGGGDTGIGGAYGTGSIVVCTWQTVKSVPALLDTHWGQDTPLNMYCPMDGGEHSLVGCVAVAAAQVLAYHEYPSVFFINGYPVDWINIKKAFHYDGTIAETNATSSRVKLLARFLSNVGKVCGMNYSAKGSSTTIKKCKRIFHMAGYNSMHHYKKYRGHHIISMLDNSNPVILSADTDAVENGVLKRVGHAWVIDGYRLQNQVGSNHHVYGQRYLMHCNWGWFGYMNGYYESKLFDMQCGAIELDNKDYYLSYTSDFYRYRYNTLTYDNPKHM